MDLEEQSIRDSLSETRLKVTIKDQSLQDTTKSQEQLIKILIAFCQKRVNIPTRELKKEIYLLAKIDDHEVKED